MPLKVKNKSEVFQLSSKSEYNCFATDESLHRVANRYGFSDKLTSEGIILSQNITVPHAINSLKIMRNFEDQSESFFSNRGFTTMQYSKIRNTGIENDLLKGLW